MQKGIIVIRESGWRSHNPQLVIKYAILDHPRNVRRGERPSPCRWGWPNIHLDTWGRAVFHRETESFGVRKSRRVYSWPMAFPVETLDFGAMQEMNIWSVLDFKCEKKNTTEIHQQEHHVTDIFFGCTVVEIFEGSNTSDGWSVVQIGKLCHQRGYGLVQGFGGPSMAWNIAKTQF